MLDDNKFWSDGGIPLEDLTVWIVQFCTVCSYRSQPVKNENELIDEGWVLHANLNLCPSCQRILVNQIREQGAGYNDC